MQEDVTSNIINHLFSNGWGWGMLGLFLFGLFWAIYKKILSNEKIQDAIAYWFTSRAFKVSIKDVKRHNIFSVKSKMKNKVELLRFENDPLKTKVFRVFFGTKLDVDIEIIKDFANSDFKDLEKNELHEKMTDLLEKMKLTYNDAVKPELQKLCENEFSLIVGDKFNQSHAIECSNKIYEHVMYAPKGYDEFRTYRIESLLYDFDLIKESPIYDNNNERVFHFLSLLGHNIEKAIMRAAKIYQDFNGEIDKIFNEQIKKINKV